MLLKQVDNGATVIAIKELKKEKVILCLQPEHVYQYVTWIMDTEENTYLGHYFLTIEDAVKDFLARF